MASAFGMISLGFFCFGYTPHGGMWLLMPFLALFAIGYGGNNTLRAILLREYFGRSKFGTIYGFTMGIAMVGNIVGAPLAGWVFDNWGSYQAIWFVFAGLAVAALITAATIPPVSTPTCLPEKARP